MKIAVDAMGGDHAPEVTSTALSPRFASSGSRRSSSAGRPRLEALLKKRTDTVPPEIEIVEAPDVIEMDDAATAPIRQKRNSSIRVAANCVREGAPTGWSRPDTPAPPWSPPKW